MEPVMVKKGLLSLLAALALLGILAGSALAQNYSFSVPTAVVDVYYNQDGTASIDYTYTFANDPGAPAIEYVDLGVPFPNFDLSSVKADVNGNSVSDIQKADPQYLQDANAGVTIGLGGYSIPAGQTGTVHISIGTVHGVLYPYSGDKKDYASLNFYPNFFGSQYVSGTTDMTVTIYLPPGVQNPDEPVYYTPGGNWPGPAEPKSGFSPDGRIYYTWQSPNANSYTRYEFGAAFPAQYVAAGSIVQPPPSISIDTSTLCCFGFGVVFLAVVGLSIYGALVGARKRKLQYLPPKISIEGHGIKRGLTAVEAAILMEQPMDKILTMILFGVIKKGAAKVTTRDPLELEVTSPLSEGLNDYEVSFLKAFSDKKGADRKAALQDMMIGLVQTVSEKMKGFSRKETLAYYQDIMNRAWQQVEAADTPEVKSQKLDENLEWTMLDKEYDDHTRRAFGTGPVFIPMWWGNYDPVFRGGGGAVRPASVAVPAMPSGGKTTINLPSLPGGQFAASMVGGVQSFASGVIGDINTFTGNITNKTNPVPKPTTTGTRWGGGGGGGCACACACAGCACACAGGGR
jgi:hypothetical protein